MDCLDQAGVDALGNVIAVEGFIQCSFEAADPGIEYILLDASCIECGDGLLMGLVCAVELLIGASPDLPVGIDHELRPCALGKGHVVDLAEVQIHVGEHAESLARGFLKLALLGKKLLFLGGEGVLALAKDLLQIDSAVVEGFVLKPFVYVLDLEDLGIHVADCGFQLGIDLADQADLALILGVVGFRRGLERGIDVDLLSKHECICQPLHCCNQILRTLSKVALELAGFLNLLLKSLEIVLPSLVAGIEAAQVPFVGLGHLTS